MVDLAHTVQVKKKVDENYELFLEKYKGKKFSNAFTCEHCKLGYGFDSDEPSLWIRCKPCNHKMKTWQKCKKWKKRIKANTKFNETIKFITLTIQNPITQWNHEIDHEKMKLLVWKPWNKFKRRLLRRGDIRGGLYAYEYTYDEEDWQASIEGDAISTFDDHSGEGGMYQPTTSHHPHLHIIALADYLPQNELLKDWRECVGHEKCGVHIKAIPIAEHALGYVTKYISKSSEVKRNREPFGCLRGGS